MPDDYARQLRRDMTDAERRLWSHLRARQIGGAKFRRQVPIGLYIADFFCPERRLIVELDGGQHAVRTAEDAERTAWLNSRGYRVRRFWNHQVFEELDSVLEAIGLDLTAAPIPGGSPPASPPSPLEGEGTGGRLRDIFTLPP